MPQLSPLNWVLLFLFYWSFVYMLVTLFWWTKSNSYCCKVSVLKSGKFQKWNW